MLHRAAWVLGRACARARARPPPAREVTSFAVPPLGLERDDEEARPAADETKRRSSSSSATTTADCHFAINYWLVPPAGRRRVVAVTCACLKRRDPYATRRIARFHPPDGGAFEAPYESGFWERDWAIREAQLKAARV